MNSSDWSAIISAITLLAAILSPVVTTIINNRHQAKLKKQAFFDSHRAEVIENFIRYTGSVNEVSSYAEDFREYGKRSKEIYLYIPEHLWHYVDSIDNAIFESEYKNASKLLANFCKELNQYHPRPIKNKRYSKNK